jgi:malate dehydrogenase
MDKVAIIGAGQVGATTAQRVAESGLADVVLLDVVEGMATGKALDIAQSLAFLPVASRVEGGSDYGLAEGADLVVVTAGLPRKPGMSRDDLLSANAAIVREVIGKVREAAPHAILIMVTNPLDEMAWLAWQECGFDKHRVLGMAGTLDCSRFQYFIGRALDVPPHEVRAMIMGSHGDSMVVLPEYTQVGGVPLSRLMPPEEIEVHVARARDGGAEIVSHLKTGSAFYAPSAAAFRLVRAILRNENCLLPASVYLEGELGIEGIFMGVPVILGRNGWKRVVEVELDPEESSALIDSATHIRAQIEQLKQLLQG